MTTLISLWKRTRKTTYFTGENSASLETLQGENGKGFAETLSGALDNFFDGKSNVADGTIPLPPAS